MIESPTKERVVETPPFGAPHIFVLAQVSGSDTGGAHRLTARETVVGRGARADLVVADEEVSKKHCIVRVDSGAVSVLDLDSRNGTLVNDRPLRPNMPKRLRHLDEIRVGSLRLVLLTGRFREAARAVVQETSDRA